MEGASLQRTRGPSLQSLSVWITFPPQFGMALELPLACHSEASSQADYPVHLWAETDRPAQDCTVNLHMKTNEGMGWGQGQHSVVDILTAKNCSEVKEDVSSTLVCIPMTRNPDVPNTEKLNKYKSF